MKPRVVGMTGNAFPDESLRVMVGEATPDSTPWSQDLCILPVKDIEPCKGLWFGAHNACRRAAFFPCKIFPPRWHVKWAFGFQILGGKFLLNYEVCGMTSASHGHSPQPTAYSRNSFTVKVFPSHLLCCVDSMPMDHTFQQPLNSGVGWGLEGRKGKPTRGTSISSWENKPLSSSTEGASHCGLTFNWLVSLRNVVPY